MQGFLAYSNHDQDSKPQLSYKAQNQDFKDILVLCTLKIKIASQNLEDWCFKNQWLYPIQDLDSRL